MLIDSISTVTLFGCCSKYISLINQGHVKLWFFLLVIYLVVVVIIHWDLHVNRDTQVILVTMDLFCFSRWNTESQGNSVVRILRPNITFVFFPLQRWNMVHILKPAFKTDNILQFSGSSTQFSTSPRSHRDSPTCSTTALCSPTLASPSLPSSCLVRSTSSVDRFPASLESEAGERTP